MNRIYLYANLSEDEAKIFDRIAEDLGYANRTEITTSLIHSLIYGKNFRTESDEVNNTAAFVEEYNRLRTEFIGIVEEYAFPIVAMHGAKYSFQVLKEDFKIWMYDRCKKVPQEADMKSWLDMYSAINRGKILQYRLSQTTARYTEEHEIQED